MSKALKPAVFLDRDGVLNHPEVRDGRPYAPMRLEDFVLYPEAPDAVARLKAAGYLAIVVTNQKDVGAGKTAAAVVERMHERLRAEMEIDAIYLCTCVDERSEEHTSELQSLMRISYAVFC